MKYLVRNIFICILLFHGACIANTTNEILNSSSPSETMSRGKIMDIYREAIVLNEDFKSSVGSVDLNILRQKRWRVEKYHEDYLEPAYTEMVKQLSSNDDIELLTEYFKLLVSFENSADEGLSFALGEILLANPKLIKKAVIGYGTDKRSYIIEKIRNGWENVVATYGIKSEDTRFIVSMQTLDELEKEITDGKK